MENKFGLVLLASSGTEKSADGSGDMVRGNYYVGGVLYENVVLIDGKSVYSLDGKLIGFVDN